MWPPSEIASWLYNIANMGLIIGLIITFVSTVLVIWMGNIKEQYLKVNLADTMERAANADQRAAEANLKAEEERLARVKIEEKLSPRLLSVEQYNNLRDRLAKYAGTTIEVIVYPTGTPDIIPLSHQISSIFRDAKWEVVYLKCTGSALFFKGIIVAINNESDSNILNAAKILVEGLNSNGIDTVLKNSFDQEVGWFISSAPVEELNTMKNMTCIKILIGTKP